MNKPVRTFDDQPAVRSHVPLLVGLMGPSGCGKTYSSLRLATGIQQVSGGDIFVIDTESRRALHYADQFKFRHIDFKAPFGSVDYLAAMQYCVSKGAGVIVVDSMSHEHSGPGGYLMTQDAEVDRMASNDAAKRERVKFAAWIKPAALRQQMIAGLLQLNANFIFCFRAKEKTKPVPGKEPIEMGFMPIAGEDLLFEMTLNCLLMPRANGVPTWRSDQVGERLMMKLPRQFASMFTDGRSLDEEMGVELATWAKGGAVVSPLAIEPVAEATAQRGTDAFRTYWGTLNKRDRDALKPRLKEFQKMAEDADARDADPFGLPPITEVPAQSDGDAAAPAPTEGAEESGASSAPKDDPLTLLDQARAKAMEGAKALRSWRNRLTTEQIDELRPDEQALYAAAKAVDEAASKPARE
jgi:ABC-type oligopeptide transport system ATPase subunit